MSRTKTGTVWPAVGLAAGPGVRTKQQEMTFHALGEMVSTDEDTEQGRRRIDALVRGDGSLEAPRAQALWRQRMYFEASAELGGPQEAAARRLLDYRHVAGTA